MANLIFITYDKNSNKRELLVYYSTCGENEYPDLQGIFFKGRRVNRFLSDELIQEIHKHVTEIDERYYEIIKEENHGY